MRKNIVKKSSLVVQSNKLVESRYSLTLGEQRLVLAMVSKIHKDDRDFYDYKIQIKELALILDIDIKNAYREADKITERLMERVLRIPQKNGDLLKIHWVTSALHKKGSLELSFNPKLKPYLLQLQTEFTDYRLTIITQFQSIHSIRIYQLLKQYRKIGFREFRVEELKEILGIKKEEYTEFKRFRGRVLNQAKKEFEKKNKKGYHQCDFTFKLETIREGRKINKVKFIIIQQTYQEQLPFLDSSSNKEEEQGNSIKEQLKFYGISDKQADIFSNNIKEKDIKDILEYYIVRLKSGKVQNESGAYLAKLLKDGVVVKTPHKIEKEAQQAKNKERAKQNKKEEIKVRETEKKEKEEINLKLDRIFNKLSETEKEMILSEFSLILNSVELKSYHKNGASYIITNSKYYNFLKEKFNNKL